MSIVTVNEPTLTSTVHINWQELALQVELLVMEKMRTDMERWADDRSMRAMLLGDASAGLDVCVLLAEGDWRLVEDRLWEMDTAARDYIYDWIGAVAGAEFFDIVRGKKYRGWGVE